MFVAIPISTDAPVYHFPYATMGLMGVNFAVFVATSYMPRKCSCRCCSIAAKKTINPLQWITTLFLHADIFHLLGNLVFCGRSGWSRRGSSVRCGSCCATWESA